jgi:hypothetical protein
LQIARVCLASQYPPHSAEDFATPERTNANAIEATMTILDGGLLKTDFITSASSSIHGDFDRLMAEPAGEFWRFLDLCRA